MAKKTAGKKAGKRKAGKRKSGERDATPKLDSCPFVANMTRPHTTESSGKLAGRAVEFFVAEANWKGEVRKAFKAAVAAGTKAELPTFSVSKFVNPNTGILSRSAQETAVADYNAAIDAGKTPPPSLPRYNPVVVDLIHAMRCQHLRRGSLKGHSAPPKDWDEKQYGKWHHEWKEDGETVKEPSGWFFDHEMPRRCHASRAEILIDEPDKNILIFGNLRIVCGTGTHDGSAVFAVNQTSHGNYRAGDKTRKRMSFAGIKELRNIVFKIEDKPNNGGGFTVRGEWEDVREMVYMPGQVLTAGFLYGSNGKVLDAKAIRGLDADTKGLKFKGLEAPIVGKAVPWEKLWADIQIANKPAITAMRKRGGRSADYEAGTPQSKSITNLLVNGKRVDPIEAFPFGLRGSQCHMPAYIIATGEGKVEDGFFSMGVVIGARANFPYNVGVHTAKGDEAEAEAETETEAPIVKPKKAKAAKPKKAKAAAKPKAVKPKAVKPKAAKPDDAAPPVESDTADEPETEEEEVVAEPVAAE